MTQTTDRAHAVDPADFKRRVGEAVEAHRDQLIALSHAIHADPEPAFEEHHAAQRVADAIRAAGFEVEHPAGSLPTADPWPAHRRPGTGRTAHRPPRRIRRAARPGAWLRSQHDGRPGRRLGARARRHARPVGRRDRVPGHARGGAGERQGDHDRGRADGRPRCRAPVPPLRPRSRREPAARVRGRRDRVHGTAGARRVRSVEGPERARRDDRAVRLGRAVAPAAADAHARPRDHPGRRHRREHHPRADEGVVHHPQRRSGLLRGDEGALPSAVRGRGTRRRLPGRDHVRGPCHDDEAEPDAGDALGRERRGARCQGRGAGRELGLDGHGERQLDGARPSTPTSRSRTAPRRATRSPSAKRPPRLAATR